MSGGKFEVIEMIMLLYIMTCIIICRMCQSQALAKESYVL